MDGWREFAGRPGINDGYKGIALDMHRLMDFTDALKQAAYGLLGLSVGTGTATWKFAPELQFLNENAPSIGLAMTFVFGVSGIGFAIANYKINVRRLDKASRKKPGESDND